MSVVLCTLVCILSVVLATLESVSRLMPEESPVEVEGRGSGHDELSCQRSHPYTDSFPDSAAAGGGESLPSAGGGVVPSAQVRLRSRSLVTESFRDVFLSREGGRRSSSSGRVVLSVKGGNRVVCVWEGREGVSCIHVGGKGSCCVTRDRKWVVLCVEVEREAGVLHVVVRRKLGSDGGLLSCDLWKEGAVEGEGRHQMGWTRNRTE